MGRFDLIDKLLISKNAAKKLYNRYSKIFDYDYEDFQQECFLVCSEINSHNESFLYKSCYNHFRTKVKKLNIFSANNKICNYKFDLQKDFVNDEKFFNIKMFIQDLNENDNTLLKSSIYDGILDGDTSNKYKRFNKLKMKLKNELQT